MKMKTNLNKFLTTIVLCSVLLVSLPGIGIATAQDDETLDIYGNANEDDIIDMRDLTFTARMILRLEDETELADANYDGRISVADMTQIGLIILGRESKLTLVDSSDRIVTVNKPVERIVFGHPTTAEGISILGAWDRVVSTDYWTTSEVLFPGISELPIIGGPMGYYDIDYEKVFELEPDIFLIGTIPEFGPGFEDVVATLEPEIPVVALNIEPLTLVENTRKLRYVLNTEEKGEEFLTWYEGVINDITEKTAGLSEADKPTVFLKYPGWTPETLCTLTDESPVIRYPFEIAGAINIAADLPGKFIEVDLEWLAGQNPEIIVDHTWEVYDPGAFGYEVDDSSVAEAKRETIMQMDIFAGSDVVKEGKVYLYDNELLTTPRFVVGMAYWAKWFHPELFSELDPQDIHQEYLTDFLGIDYDLDEQGAFVYPEP